MCDTFIILPDSTQDGQMIFGKNSDRIQNEIQEVIIVPSQRYAKGNILECTYIKIPQVTKTLAVILSKPNWMWGAEMGANEANVVIGNVAIWSNEPYKNTGLLGMDLVRLGLERGSTAKQALYVIIELLTKYGQGGYCTENSAMNYHNSFLLADVKEAYILETAGEYWVVERVKTGIRSISNALTIRDKGNFCHKGVVEYAIKIGQCHNKNDFDFARIFSEGEYELPTPQSREGRVRELCDLNRGKFSIETAKSILRDHKGSICMHGEFETTGSQISVLTKKSYEHWFIEQPLPCKQDYKQYDFYE